MPSRERALAFVEAVLAGDFVQSIRDFYAEDATAQENLSPPRVGRGALVTHEQKALGSMGKVSAHRRPHRQRALLLRSGVDPARRRRLSDSNRARAKLAAAGR